VNRVLVDTNVVLDVLLDRHPHAQASSTVWAAIETGTVEGLLAGHAITTIHYLIQKQLGNAKTTRFISRIVSVFGVAAIDQGVIQEAIQLPCPDFEDAVTSAAARVAGCDYIVTRDPKGFRGSAVRCLTPEMALRILVQAP